MMDMIVLGEVARKLGMSTDGVKSLASRANIEMVVGPKYGRGNLTFVTQKQMEQLKILHAQETLTPQKKLANLGGYAGVSTRAAYDEIVAIRAELKAQRAVVDAILKKLHDVHGAF